MLYWTMVKGTASNECGHFIANIIALCIIARQDSRETSVFCLHGPDVVLQKLNTMNYHSSCSWLLGDELMLWYISNLVFTDVML